MVIHQMVFEVDPSGAKLCTKQQTNNFCSKLFVSHYYFTIYMCAHQTSRSESVLVLQNLCNQVYNAKNLFPLISLKQNSQKTTHSLFEKKLLPEEQNYQNTSMLLCQRPPPQKHFNTFN